MHTIALRRRIGGIAAALALQAAFIALLIGPMPAFRPGIPVRETILRLLETRPARPPTVIDARGRKHPDQAAPIPQAPVASAPSTAILPAPPEALRSFGEALNGCAPERYADLPPEQKARCARPGEGLVVKNAPNPLGEKNHMKEEAYWQEEFDEAHWQPKLCQAGDGYLVYQCLINQTQAENARAGQARTERATRKATALAGEKPASSDVRPPAAK